VIYLLIAIGAIKGLAGHRSSAKLYLAIGVGVVVTIAAIFGAIYKVTAPTVYAPYAGVVVLIVGLVAASAMKQAPKSVADFSALNETEQGPTKL